LLRTRLLAPVTLAATLVASPMAAGLAMAADPVVTVKRGDTLSGISKTHGVPIATIVALNSLPDPNRIFPGQQLRIESAPVEPRAAAGSGSAAAGTHVVLAGENLTRIAKKHGTTIAAIAAANDITNPSRIYAGQRLSIPGRASKAAPPPAAPAAPAAAARPAAATHVVGRGENLTRIARHYGTTISAIVAANGIADASRIYAGQRLTIPGAPAAPASAPATGGAMPATMAALTARRGDVRAMIVEEAERYGVPAAFALAVAWQESGWRQEVVSHAGAIGVMQLMPATAEWIGEAMLGTPVDSRDARQNVRAGVRLLAHYLDRYDGDRELVLAAYYQGQTAADRHGVYPVSRSYIASITSLVRLFGG
jgi:N-acetylmuramoyl-L-alanine amidase